MRIHFECHEPRFPQVVHDSLHILAISTHVAGEPRNGLCSFRVGDGSEHLPAGAPQSEPRHDPVAYHLLFGPFVNSRKPVPSGLIIAICAPPSTRSARPRNTSWNPLKNARNEPMPNTMASPLADHCGPSTLRVGS